MSLPNGEREGGRTAGAMGSGGEVVITGLGWALPAAGPPLGEEGARPAPSSAAERAMFTASGGRRWIGEGESLDELMIAAARGALDDAGLPAVAAPVDRLYGYGLVSRYQSPNPVYAVHFALGLPRTTWVLPVAADFSTFLASLALARDALRSGAAERALVVAGAFLSRHVHPSSGYAVAIGDAACAAVLERGGLSRAGLRAPRSPGLLLWDCAQESRSDLYEAGMVSSTEAPGGLLSPPAFRLNPALLEPMREHGIIGPVAVARALLARHGVAPASVTLIAHQASRVLMGLWREALQPAEYLDTYDEYGNITAASTGVTLGVRREALRTPWVLLLSVGAGMHSCAALLRVPHVPL